LFWRFTYFHPRCLGAIAFIGTWGRNGPFYAMYHATKTQKDAYSRRWWSSIRVTPKDVIYHLKTIHPGATGYFVEYGSFLKTWLWKAVWPFVI
jgi:hypothetical protein